MDFVWEYWGSRGLNVLSSVSWTQLHHLNSILLGAPSYVGRIKQGRFPLVLRNLHIPAIILLSFIMVLVLAVVPLHTVLQGANVLSILAELVSTLYPYSVYLIACP